MDYWTSSDFKWTRRTLGTRSSYRRSQGLALFTAVALTGVLILSRKLAPALPEALQWIEWLVPASVVFFLTALQVRTFRALRAALVELELRPGGSLED